MNKNKILLISLLAIFCLSIGSVCAAENSEIVSSDLSQPLEQVNVQEMAQDADNQKTVTADTNDLVDIDDVIDAAKRYNAYIVKNKALPKVVQVGYDTYTHEQFTSLMAQTIYNLNKGDVSPVISSDIKSSSGASYPTKVTLTKNKYLVLTNENLKFILNNNRNPNYIQLSKIVKIDYRTYSYAYSKILTYYDNNERLPNSCLFDSSVFNPGPKPGPTPPGPTPPGPTPAGKISIASVLASAVSYKNYVAKYKALPKSVKVAGKTYTTAQFTYLMSKAISQIAKKNRSPLSVGAVKMCNEYSYKCNRYYTLNQYVGFADVVLKYANDKKAIPSYIKYAKTVVVHKVYASAFANILTYYKVNGKLPGKALFTSANLR